MRSPRSSRVQVLAASVLVFASACNEPTRPTAVPRLTDASLAAGQANSRFKIKTFQLSANTIRIAGPAVNVQASLGNSGQPASDIKLRAEISQGSATRQAALLDVACLGGGQAGVLPNGNCDVAFDATASNGTPGSGTLVAGSATFILHLVQVTGAVETELANKTILVNLVGTPSITSLTLAPTTLVIDGTQTSSYTVTLANPANSLQGVILQAYITQGLTTTRAAGGTVVSCGSAPGVFPPGTCTMTFSTSASNAGAGAGTLVPGPATFELQLLQSGGGQNTMFDKKTVAITLIAKTPRIASLTLSTTTLTIDGPAVNYTAALGNPGPELTGIILQGELTQTQGATTVTVAAGGTLVQSCGGAALGTLPNTGVGTCNTSFTITTSSTVAGGPAVPGPAQFVLHLTDGTTELDTMTVNVTLVAPTPTITSVALPGSYYVLGSGSASYTAQLNNPGLATMTGMILQAYISQGTARRAAAGTLIRCNGGPLETLGSLPPGDCSSPADIVAGNDPAAGDGTLVYGPATLEIQLLDGGGTVYDTKTFPITLVAPTPSIVSISLASSTFTIDGSSVGYTAVVYNPTTSSLSTVLLQAWIEAGFAEGAARRGANGTLVNCGASSGVLPPGSCSFSFTAAASNSGSGDGTLQAGPATLKFELRVGGTLVDTKTLSITLVGP